MPDKNGKLTPDELKRRWKTDEGKKFRDEIIRQLKSDKHYVEWLILQVTTEDGRTIHWRDFQGVVEVKNEWERIKDEEPYVFLSEPNKSNSEWGDLRGIDLRLVEIPHATLEFCSLEHADLSGARLEHANLYGASLEHADLRGASLEHADLRGARLEHAYLYEARLEHADLRRARLEHANLLGAGLEHADLRGARLGNADITDAKFKLKSFWWRTGIIGLLEKRGMDISRYKPTLLEGAEIRNAKADSEPVLLRDLLDEQYLDKKEWVDPKFYRFWLLTSNCGRGVWLLFGWSVMLALGFGLLYAELYSPARFPNWLQTFLSWLDPEFQGLDPEHPWLSPIYMSFVTMTTLGWATVNPANWQGYLWHTLQNLLGYIWLGYLVAVLGSKLTRRSG